MDAGKSYNCPSLVVSEANSDTHQSDKDDHDMVEMATLRVSHHEVNTAAAATGSVIDVLSHRDPDEDSLDGAVENNENVFAIKKTLAQGMMDVALITANANQLRYIIEFNSKSKTYQFVFTMILISIVLQLIVGVSLIWIGKKDYHAASFGDDPYQHQQHQQMLAFCNKFILIGVFFITIINIFIATFPISDRQ